MTGIRRLFLPHVGARGPVKHLFDEFLNSLGNLRAYYQDVSHERRQSRHSRLHEMTRGARERHEFLPDELESLRAVLCELLAKESCAEWLGFNDLARSDAKPPVRHLAWLVLESDWTDAENIHKLRMYRAAAFIEFLRPGAIDWRTPHIPDMEWVLEFIKVFTRRRISREEQSDLIADLTRAGVPVDSITKAERGERLTLSESRYVWETRGLSHEERARAWDNRTPKPFLPFGRSNLEMYRDKKLAHRWRVAVNHQVNKARASRRPILRGARERVGKPLSIVSETANHG